MIDRRQLVSPTGDIYMPSKLFNTDASALTYSTNNQNILCWAEKHDEGESFPDYLILDFDIPTSNYEVGINFGNNIYSEVLSGDVLIDWGDNSSNTYTAGNKLVQQYHTYTNAGKYSVKIYGKAWIEHRGTNSLVQKNYGNECLTRVYGTYNINDRKTVALENSEGLLSYFFYNMSLPLLKEFNIEIPKWTCDIECTATRYQYYIFYAISGTCPLEKFRFICRGAPDNWKLNTTTGVNAFVDYINTSFKDSLKTIEIETGEFPKITNVNSLKIYGFNFLGTTNQYFNNVEEITFKIPTTLPSNADLTDLTFASNDWYYNLFEPFRNLQKIKKFKFVELPFDTNPLVGSNCYKFAFVCRDASYITDNNMYTVKFEGENGEKLTATDIINGNPARSSNTNCFSTYVIDPTDWNNLPTTWRSSS